MQNFRPIGAEIKKNPVSIFEIAIACHRNTMRAQYKDRCQNSINRVGIVTPLHLTKNRCCVSGVAVWWTPANIVHMFTLLLLCIRCGCVEDTC